MLTEKQVEALTELINVSIGFAANSLGEIIDTPVTLKVPELRVFSSGDRDELHTIFGKKDAYAIVKQDFQGNLAGTTALAFPPDSAGRLVSLLTDLEVSDDDLDIMQTGTLLEVGNIINNAFLATLNQQFNFQVNYKLPEFNEVNIAHLLDATFGSDEHGLVIVANTSISVKVKDIEGHLLLLFKVINLEFLAQKLDQMVAGS